MKCFAKTDLGKARELNEDSYYIPSDENELRIYMLADGMGGYNGGEIASKLAIESARKYLTNNWQIDFLCYYKSVENMRALPREYLRVFKIVYYNCIVVTEW